MLRHCVSDPSITHLFRTIPPHVVTGFLQRFDIEVVHAFETVTAVQLNRYAQQEFALPLDLCGFMLSNTDLHAPCTYVASISLVFNSELQEARDFVKYDAAWEQIASFLPQELQQMGMVWQSRLSSMIDKEARRNLLEQVNQFDKARLLAVSNRHASA
ncbi:hypothetical protein GJ496_005392 [Pomphorhynchus laevis]|nr:hypothetical protein GJ496_005392 [Pomphorhynchus laevis]